VALASTLPPFYIAEISPPRVRGTLVVWNRFAIFFGILVIYFANYGIARAGSGNAWLNTTGWHFMFLSGTAPATLFLVLLFFVPQTPRFLLLKGRETGARAVMAKLATPERNEKEVAEIRASLRQRRSKLFSFGALLIVIGILLSVFRQFVGISVVLYDATDIFSGMGLSTDAALLHTIIAGAVNMVFTPVAILTVDRFGRSPLQIFGARIMAAGMIAPGTELWLGGQRLGALICMLVYTAAFALFRGPVTWVLLSEIFPNQIPGNLCCQDLRQPWFS
jgi:MFS transporter, SP family, xylose:H+ symportor